MDTNARAPLTLAKWVILAVYLGGVGLPFLAEAMFRASGQGLSGGIAAVSTLRSGVFVLLVTATIGTAMALRDLRARPEARTSGNLLASSAGVLAFIVLLVVLYRLLFA